MKPHHFALVVLFVLALYFGHFLAVEGWEGVLDVAAAIVGGNPQLW